MPAPFAIIIYDNQATAVSRGNIGPLAHHLSLSSTIPGGNGQCRFRLAAPIGLVPDFLNFNYEVRVSDAGEVFWSGRIEDLIAHRDGAGEYWEVTAYGFGVNLEDQIYGSAQNVQNVVTSTVASNTLTNAPQIDVSTITASGFTIANTAAVNLKMMTMSQVVNWAARFGKSATYDGYLWYVYPDADGTVRFTFTTRPTTTTYALRLPDCELVEFGLVGRRLANRVVVQYNDGASVATQNDTALQGAGPAGWNLLRTLQEFVPEVVNSADATQIANALLTRYKQKYMGARSIQLKPSALILDGNGQRIEPWRMRAGYLAQILDVDAAQGASGTLGFTNSFLVQETVWDQDSQTLSLIPEYRDLSPQAAFAQLFAVLRGRHTMQAR